MRRDRKHETVTMTPYALTRFSILLEEGDPDDCWEWPGPIDRAGYGILRARDFKIKAHRAAWIAAYGPFPRYHTNRRWMEDLFVCHHCDNRRCCNHHHLFLGTQSDNLIDMSRKGRGRGRFSQPKQGAGDYSVTGPPGSRVSYRAVGA